MNLNLALRGNHGMEVPSGSNVRAIVGNRQLVAFINCLVPNPDTDHFVVVITPSGVIAATALEQVLKPGEFTTQAVTPLE